MEYQPIGIIHSPFQEPAGMPIQPAAAGDTEGKVEIFPEFSAGLKDLEGFSHLILIYHFHRSQGYRLQVVPFLDTEPRGVFATRAPKRPNPIGISVVRLQGVDGRTLAVSSVDILDGTPLLDIKPYVPDFAPGGEVRIGWLEKNRRTIRQRQADDRFK
ncbi:MAG: tRNA (N6-threonylcarbamoyladenosine(37)-N6)-methyltransferase TrmO [Deltaproteobacteria bacterium]|nr:tRNA (N6-threonylcarbamoyladenosine(37)-N6)-methyltransferase TrmO [Deltaproteobacteria bacterium]